MRVIENLSAGETVDRILVFASQEERVFYASRENLSLNYQQERDLLALRGEYQKNINGGSDPDRTLREHMEKVRLVHVTYARRRAELASLVSSSILEGDLPDRVTF